MWPSSFDSAGAQRLLIAAGISVALHAALALSVNRNPAGNAMLSQPQHAVPLIARLATAVTDSVMSAMPDSVPAQAPAVSATTPVFSPSPPVTTPPETASASGTHYFKSSELDRRPFPLTRIIIPEPESATAESGAVMIRLLISERGRVEDARIVFGTGVAEFEASALHEFSSAKFQPGYRGNLAVPSEMLIEVTLRPPKADATQAAAPSDSTQNRPKPGTGSEP